MYIFNKMKPKSTSRGFGVAIAGKDNHAKKPNVGLRPKGFGRTSQITRAEKNSSSPDNDSFKDWVQRFDNDQQLPGFWFDMPSDFLVKGYLLRMLHRRFLRNIHNLLIQLFGNDYKKEDVYTLLASYGTDKISDLENELVILNKILTDLYAKHLRVFGEPPSKKELDPFDDFNPESVRLAGVFDVVDAFAFSGVLSYDPDLLYNSLPSNLCCVIDKLVRKKILPYPFTEITQWSGQSYGFEQSAEIRYREILLHKNGKITKLEALFFLCLSQTLEFLVVENWSREKIEMTLSVNVGEDLQSYQQLLLVHIPYNFSEMLQTYESQKNLLICLYEILKEGFFLTEGFLKIPQNIENSNDQKSLNSMDELTSDQKSLNSSDTSNFFRYFGKDFIIEKIRKTFAVSYGGEVLKYSELYPNRSAFLKLVDRIILGRTNMTEEIELPNFFGWYWLLYGGLFLWYMVYSFQNNLNARVKTRELISPDVKSAVYIQKSPIASVSMATSSRSIGQPSFTSDSVRLQKQRTPTTPGPWTSSLGTRPSGLIMTDAYKRANVVSQKVPIYSEETQIRFFKAAVRLIKCREQFFDWSQTEKSLFFLTSSVNPADSEEKAQALLKDFHPEQKRYVCLSNNKARKGCNKAHILGKPVVQSLSSPRSSLWLEAVKELSVSLGGTEKLADNLYTKGRLENVLQKNIQPCFYTYAQGLAHSAQNVATSIENLTQDDVNSSFAQIAQHSKNVDDRTKRIYSGLTLVAKHQQELFKEQKMLASADNVIAQKALIEARIEAEAAREKTKPSYAINMIRTQTKNGPEFLLVTEDNLQGRDLCHHQETDLAIVPYSTSNLSDKIEARLEIFLDDAEETAFGRIKVNG